MGRGWSRFPDGANRSGMNGGRCPDVSCRWLMPQLLDYCGIYVYAIEKRSPRRGKIRRFIQKCPRQINHYHIHRLFLQPLCNIRDPNLHLPHLHPFRPRLLPHTRHGPMPIVLVAHGDQVALILYLALEATLQVKLLPHFFHKGFKHHVRCQHDKPCVIPVVDFDSHILQSVDILA